jgi:predicted phage tail protein
MNRYALVAALALAVCGVAWAAFAVTVSSSWEAPTQREDGTPLDAAELSHYDLSCDGGIFARIDGSSTTHTITTTLTPGEYSCQLVAVDIYGSESEPAVASFSFTGQDISRPRRPDRFNLTITVN